MYCLGREWTTCADVEEELVTLLLLLAAVKLLKHDVVWLSCLGLLAAEDVDVGTTVQCGELCHRSGPSKTSIPNSGWQTLGLLGGGEDVGHLLL